MNREFDAQMFEMLLSGLLRGSVRDNISFDRNFQRFSALRTNKERIEFIEGLAQQDRITVAFAFHTDIKSNLIADGFREKGNMQFRNGDHDKAHFLYNESLRYAETGSSAMAKAYGNRSAVLFAKAHYEQCIEIALLNTSSAMYHMMGLRRISTSQISFLLKKMTDEEVHINDKISEFSRITEMILSQDIKRALESGYPADSSKKLLKRQEDALKLKEEQKWQYHEPVPEFKPYEKNEAVVNASNSIKMKKNGNDYKILATRDIKIGDFVVIEKPYISALTDRNLVHCFGCLELCFNMIPCPSCTVALYCTEECRTAWWSKYHKLECKLLKTLYNYDLDFWVLPLRMTFSARDLYSKIDKLANESSDTYRSDRFLEVYKLSTAETYIDRNKLWLVTEAALALTNLVGETTDLFTTSNVTKVKIVFAILLLHNVLNSFKNGRLLNKLTNVMYFRDIQVGCGIYPLTSVFRFSCDPNVIPVFYGDTIAVRAIQNIKKNEEIFITNGCTYVTTPRSVRQDLLRQQFNYICKCTACANFWPELENLPVYNENFILECKRAKIIMDNIEISDVEAIKKHLADILTKARTHNYSHPSYDWAFTEALLRHCFIILGNKHIHL